MIPKLSCGRISTCFKIQILTPIEPGVGQVPQGSLKKQPIDTWPRVRVVHTWRSARDCLRPQLYNYEDPAIVSAGFGSTCPILALFGSSHRNGVPVFRGYQRP